MLLLYLNFAEKQETPTVTLALMLNDGEIFEIEAADDFVVLV